jgi:hypothetical protein
MSSFFTFWLDNKFYLEYVKIQYVTSFSIIINYYHITIIKFV